MMNKWRFVRYEDDGVSEYQCLKCKGTWSCRGAFGTFCSWCGTKWDGELVWYTEERQEWHAIRARAAYRKPSEQSLWRIESRSLWDRNGDGNWKPWVYEETDGWHDDESEGYNTSLFSAKTIASILADKRRWAKNDNFWRVEYRIVMRMAAA